MATPNFSCYNADNVYVVEVFDDYTAEELQEQVHELLDGDKDYYIHDIEEYDDDRSYPAMFVSKIGKQFEFNGLDICVSIDFGIRAGYYSANNLDFRLSVECCNAWGWMEPFEYIDTESSYYGYQSPMELAQDFVKDIDDNNVIERVDGSKGTFRMNKEKMAKRIAAEMFEMMELGNRLCKELCESEYACVGVFSNGEAIYEAV